MEGDCLLESSRPCLSAFSMSSGGMSRWSLKDLAMSLKGLMNNWGDWSSRNEVLGGGMRVCGDVR
jgi:hypothetical protein